MPFNATFSARFSGILKTSNEIELVYPEAFTISSNYVGVTNIQISCSVSIGGVVYQPKCMLDTSTRSVVFSQITNLNLDFTSLPNGELIQMVVKGIFLNPQSEEPMQVKVKLSIRDTNGSIIAYYDWATSTR